jgi:hypothetical protein
MEILKKEGFKEDIKKLLEISIFLLVSVVFILPYLIQISTFFHEKAHVNTLEKYGIKSDYNVDWLRVIPNFYNPNVEKLGVTSFDVADYKKLNKYQRTEVNLAGIISDLKFLFLIGVYLSMTFVYIYYKVRYKRDYDLSFLLAVEWVLFMWLLALTQITVANLTGAGGDISHLIKYLRV